MIQVAKYKCKKLDDAIEYINNISIRYSYLKDYQIIKEDDNYNVLLDFDIPTEVCQFLELATFNIVKDKSYHIYKTIYNIDVEEKKEDSWSARIFFDEIRNGIQMQGIFGFKNIDTFLRITYDDAEDNFVVELRNYNFERSMLGWHTRADEVLFMREIDYTVIYNHVVKLLLNRGYLISKMSLNEFKDHVFYLTKWLNRKEFEDYIKLNQV